MTSSTETSSTGSAPATTTSTRRQRRRSGVRSTLLRHSLLMLLAFVGIVALLEAVSPFRASQLTVLAYYLPAVAGLTVLTGINGQISLGHGALMAVGAYTAAVLLQRAPGLPFLVVVLAAVLTASVVGAVVGVAAARLHGPYLAGATLALAVGLPGLAVKFESLLGGEQGLRVTPPKPPGWLLDAVFFVTGQDLLATKYLGYFAWLLALVVLVLLSNLLRSRYGRMWRAVRDDEVAAQLAGINLGRARVLAFVVSAACAGLAGALLAVTARLAAPGSFSLVLSISLLVAIVLGGLGSLLGAVLGSAVLVFLAPFVTDTGLSAGLSSAQAANIAPLVYGVVLIVVMLAAPQGIVGSVRGALLRRRASRQLAAGPAR